MLIEELNIEVKDKKGFTTIMSIPQVNVITHHGGYGVIAIESSILGTFGFVAEDTPEDYFFDRTYVLDRSTLYGLALDLGLCGDEDE